MKPFHILALLSVLMTASITEKAIESAHAGAHPATYDCNLNPSPDAKFTPEAHIYDIILKCKDNPEDTGFVPIKLHVEWLPNDKSVYERIDRFGTIAEIRATCPDDPVIFDGDCSNISFNYISYPITQLYTELHSRKFLHDLTKEILREELKHSLRAWNYPPRVLQPTKGSTQTDPMNVMLAVKIMFPKFRKCDMWHFTTSFDRMVSGKWGNGAANSYVIFDGYPQEVHDGTTYCYGKHSFSFKPGQYRVSVKAHNDDGRKTPWSPWKEFAVQPKLVALDADKIPAGIHFTTPEANRGFSGGEKLHIRWVSFKTQGKVVLTLAKGNPRGKSVTKREITSPEGVENTGYWRWTIPEDLPFGDYYIVIKTIDEPHLAARLIKVLPKIQDKALSQFKPSLKVDKFGHGVTLELPGQSPHIQFQRRDGNMWRLIAAPRMLSSRKIPHKLGVLTRREYQFDAPGKYRYLIKDGQWTEFEIKGQKETGPTTAVSRKTYKAPRITPFAMGMKFSPGDRISLRADYDRAYKLTFVLQQKGHGGYKTLQKTGRSIFSNLDPGLYRVGAVYEGEVKMPGDWVEFSVTAPKKIEIKSPDTQKVDPNKVLKPKTKVKKIN